MAKNAVSKLNFPKHPYGEIMTESTLNNITREDIIASYKNNFKPNGGYLVVVGDINRIELEDLITKYLLAWRTNGPIFTNPANDGVFPIGNRVVFIKNLALFNLLYLLHTLLKLEQVSKTNCH